MRNRLVYLFLVAIASHKKLIRPRTARIIAAIFLFLGILIGAFDVPQYLGELTGYKLPAFANFPFRFGLDIQGGTHLVYQADMKSIAFGEQASSMEAVKDVIERRVNLFGVAEPVVQVEKSGGDWRLIVELAGIKDVGAAIRLIGETPYLEFKEERPGEETEKILKKAKEGGALSEDPYFIPTPLTGRHVKKAQIGFDQTTYQPRVNLELNDEGAKIFSDLTKRNVGKRIAIYLDGAPISAPVVREEITDGKAQISGNFTPQAAKELVGRLNAGALPVPISLISQQSVGASLGEESLERSIQAGLYGFLAVAVFMIFWYRLPGLLAVSALLFYVAIILAVFKLIPVTLTVAGIAGFILSVGMAVDANVLIFERLKEELKNGRALEEAIREGFGRAWTSIRDSNVSSLITSAILYWLGTSVVQGFALTLSIGIGVSMFSAILVTRTLLIAVMSRKLEAIRFVFFSGISR